jgi:hypothetical protein
MERVTEARQLLKLVAMEDDAIDWKATYPDLDIEGEDEDAMIEKKKKAYAKHHRIGDLVFKDDAKPTVFVFEHPARVDTDRKIRRAWTELLKPGNKSDLWTDVWNETYLGKEEGLDGAAREPPPRHDGAIATTYMQMLSDAGVFDELGQAVAGYAKAGFEQAKKEGEATKKK